MRSPQTRSNTTEFRDKNEFYSKFKNQNGLEILGNSDNFNEENNELFELLKTDLSLGKTFDPISLFPRSLQVVLKTALTIEDTIRSNEAPPIYTQKQIEELKALTLKLIGKADTLGEGIIELLNCSVKLFANHIPGFFEGPTIVDWINRVEEQITHCEKHKEKDVKYLHKLIVLHAAMNFVVGDISGSEVLRSSMKLNPEWDQHNIFKFKGSDTKQLVEEGLKVDNLKFLLYKINVEIIHCEKQQETHKGYPQYPARIAVLEAIKDYLLGNKSYEELKGVMEDKQNKFWQKGGNTKALLEEAFQYKPSEENPNYYVENF